MLANFLIPENVVREDGTSAEMDVTEAKGGVLQVTLGITRIIEQQSIDVSIWGSSDKTNWGTKPLVVFPQKFYCGTYTILVDLGDHPDVTAIRAQWKVARWGRGEPKPLFGFYMFVEESHVHAASAR